MVLVMQVCQLPIETVAKVSGAQWRGGGERH